MTANAEVVYALKLLNRDLHRLSPDNLKEKNDKYFGCEDGWTLKDECVKDDPRPIEGMRLESKRQTKFRQVWIQGFVVEYIEAKDWLLVITKTWLDFDFSFGRWVGQSLDLSVCLSVFFSLCLFVWMTLCLPVCLLPVCLSVFLSPSVWLFLSLSFCLFVFVALSVRHSWTKNERITWFRSEMWLRNSIKPWGKMTERILTVGLSLSIITRYQQIWKTANCGGFDSLRLNSIFAVESRSNGLASNRNPPITETIL